MTDSRWQHFTQDEIDALVDALDHYLVNELTTEEREVAGRLYDEIVATAEPEEDDDG